MSIAAQALALLEDERPRRLEDGDGSDVSRIEPSYVSWLGWRPS